MGLLDISIRKIDEYIQEVSKYIDFDIYVVNRENLRIIGTGMYAKMLGIVLPKHTSNGWCLTNKEQLVMINPTKHTLCVKCPMMISDNCGKEYSVHEPILLDDVCLGVLTISSEYNDESKARMLRDLERLKGVIKVMSESIVRIVNEDIHLSNYQAFIQNSSESLVLTDKEGKILSYTGICEDRFQGIDNIYEMIPKNTELYGDSFSDEEVTFASKCSIKRTRIPLSENSYNQLFNIAVKGEHKSREDVFLDSNGLYMGEIIGQSRVIEELKKVVLHIANYDSNCLILGESGTGKEMFARLIHNISNRRDEEFVAINCAAIPDHLIESEIFGYEAGAFTDANKQGKIGLFEVANNGTIFLDEIGDMPIYLQPKLLRVLETGTITRIGGTKAIKLNVRFIAATNKNLIEKMHAGEFRDDLYYRLCVIPLELPSLRERREDIIELARYFIDKYNIKFNKSIKHLADDVKKQLLIYDWPGNVRELENVIEYAVTMESTDTLYIGSLPLNINLQQSVNERVDSSISDFKKQNIALLLDEHGDSVDAKRRIAKELGISLSTLYRYMKKYNLN